MTLEAVTQEDGAIVYLSHGIESFPARIRVEPAEQDYPCRWGVRPF